MITEELKKYIDNQREKGVNDADIASALKETGWNDMLVTEALGQKMKTPPAPPTDVENAPTTRSLFFLKLGTALLILLGIILAGGYYAYENLYMTPERIVAQAFQKNSDIKTFKYNGNLFVDLSQEPVNPTKMMASGGLESIVDPFISDRYSLDFTGVVDVSDSTKPLNSSTLTFTSGILPIASLEMITTSEDAYFRLSELKNLFGLVDGSDEFNRWMKVPLEGNDILSEEYIEKFEEVIKYYRDPLNLPYKNLQKVDGSILNSSNMYHITAQVDKEKLGLMILSTLEDLYGEIAPLEGREEFMEVFDQVQFGEVNLYIGKYDNYLYSTDLSMEIFESDMLTKMASVEIKFSMSNHNDEVSIVPPNDAFDLTRSYRLDLLGF